MSCGDLAADAIRKSEALQVVIDSVNRYSLTVYDINIGDNQWRTLLSTNPENQDKPLPARPDYKQLLNANPIQLIQEWSSASPRSSTWWCRWSETTSRLSPSMWAYAPRSCARPMRRGWKRRSS